MGPICHRSIEAKTEAANKDAISIPPKGRVAVPAQGENRAPPSGSGFGNQQRMSD
jgi:hypothetical protein